MQFVADCIKVYEMENAVCLENALDNEFNRAAGGLAIKRGSDGLLIQAGKYYLVERC